MENNTKKLEVSQDDLKKSLAAVGFTDDEIVDLIKKSEAVDPETKIEKGSEETSLEDLQKTYKEFEAKEGEIEKAYKSDKDDISKKKADKMAEMEEKGYKKEEKKVEKAVTDDLGKKDEKEELIKGLNEKIDSLEEKITDTKEVDEIKKSLGDVTESITSIKELVTKIANAPTGMKSHQYSQFLEKANQNDLGDGKDKKVISLRDKETLTKALEDLAESATDVDKKSHFEKAIMNYNSNPDAQLAPILIADIQKAEDCTFVV